VRRAPDCDCGLNAEHKERGLRLMSSSRIFSRGLRYLHRKRQIVHLRDTPDAGDSTKSVPLRRVNRWDFRPGLLPPLLFAFARRIALYARAAMSMSLVNQMQRESHYSRRCACKPQPDR
jgi:hypothetical protein